MKPSTYRRKSTPRQKPKQPTTSRSSRLSRKRLLSYKSLLSMLRSPSVSYEHVVKCLQYTQIAMDASGRVTISLELKRHVSPVTPHLPEVVIISKLFRRKTHYAKRATSYIKECVTSLLRMRSVIFSSVTFQERMVGPLERT